MKFLILDPYYPSFLATFYRTNKVKEGDNYQELQSRLMDSLFGTSDFYSKALIQLGHSAKEIVINDKVSQGLWARQYINQISYSAADKLIDATLGSFKFIKERVMSRWEERILFEQIKTEKPDILYCQNIGYLNSGFLKKIKPMVGRTIGQIASPIPPFKNYRVYDLIVTSFPHFVQRFKNLGIKSAYLKLAFEPRILSRVKQPIRKYDVTFVGGISRNHKRGFELLNKLADNIKIDVWGYGKESLDKNSNLYKCHHGAVWGRQMYQVLQQSKITINRHIDAAENYANNMRLYEATGCGAMLITDGKDNINELFNVGHEVEVYDEVNDLIKKIKYYQDHPKRVNKIAKAGQRRTIKDHNYQKRMTELVDIIDKYCKI